MQADSSPSLLGPDSGQPLLPKEATLTRSVRASPNVNNNGALTINGCLLQLGTTVRGLREKMGKSLTLTNDKANYRLPGRKFLRNIKLDV